MINLYDSHVCFILKINWMISFGIILVNFILKVLCMINLYNFC